MKKLLLLLLFILAFQLTYAQQILDSLRMVLPVGHTDVITSIIYSPKCNKYPDGGNFILSGSNEGKVHLWDSKTGKLIQSYEGHNSGIYSDAIISLNFLSDCQQIMTYSEDSTICIWDTFTGKLISQIGAGFYRHLEISLNKKYILALSGSSVDIFDAEIGLKLKTLAHEDNVSSAVFNSKSSEIISVTENGYLYNWDIESGEIYRKINPNDSLSNYDENNLVLTCYSLSNINAEYVLSKTFNNSVNLWNVNNWENDRVFKIKDRKILFTNISKDNKLILAALDDSTICIWDIVSGAVRNTLFHGSNLNYAELSSDNSLILTVSFDEDQYITRIWDINTLKCLREFYQHKLISANYGAFFNPQGNQILIFEDADAYIFDVKNKEINHGLNNKITLNDLNSNKIYNLHFLYQIKSGDLNWNKPNRDFRDSLINHEITRLDYTLTSPDNKYLFVRSEQGSNFLYNNEIGEIAINFSEQTLQDETFSLNSKYFFAKINDSTILFWDCQIRKVVLNLKLHAYSRFDLSPDGKYILIDNGYRARECSMYDMETRQILYTIKGRMVNGLKPTQFSQDSRYFYTTESTTLYIWDTYSGSLISTISLSQIDDEIELDFAKFSPDGSKIMTLTYDECLSMWDSETGILIKKLNGTAYENVIFNQHKNIFLTVSRGGLVTIWDSQSINLLYSLEDQVNWRHNIEFSNNGKNLTLIDFNNKLLFYDVATGNPIYERIQLENNNWLVKLPNSPYYMCSKDASKMLHYVTPSLKVIGFEQLDPVYNRPDIVLDSIGKYFGGSDQELVANYRQSWEKRIDRLGLDKEKLGKGEIAVPSAEIVGADDIAYENKDGELEIEVRANDPKYPLRRFNVFMNEVPIYGSAGISIAHLNRKDWDTTVSVPLSTGENKIQVSVMNELGLENFKYPTYVNYSPQNGLVAKTYFIGIGVNEFMDQEHNLKYCVKDVQDLAMAFADGNSNVDTLLLTNKEVTRENILALKDYLMKTSVNDKVIISCSSHGLLDDSLNFYLALHDVDFNNPQSRGLKYEELESLLDGIPARQKLLLLDACNSGENDKTEVLKKELEQKQVKMKTDEVLAARGAIVELKEENKSNFQKMNELFVNVRNNTGSVIISAAGGQEFALEGDVDGKTIENGAFTYSVLEYLNSNKTNSETLTVNKLKQYVENRVDEITNGKQKPTSRQETMEVDWGLR